MEEDKAIGGTMEVANNSQTQDSVVAEAVVDSIIRNKRNLYAIISYSMAHANMEISVNSIIRRMSKNTKVNLKVRGGATSHNSHRTTQANIKEAIKVSNLETKWTEACKKK
jgi:uncharacterized protein (DUF111 family)